MEIYFHAYGSGYNQHLNIFINFNKQVRSRKTLHFKSIDINEYNFY